MKKIIIVGAGDLGKQLYHYIQDIDDMEVIGFLDDFAVKGYPVIDEAKVLGDLASIEELFKDKVFDEVVVGIGYRHLEFRREVFISFKEKGLVFAKLVHPTAYVDRTAIIEEGVIVFPNCYIDKGSRVSNNSLLNIGCSIAHDSRIGPHCFLGPGVNIAGFVVTEGMNFIGIGSIIIDNVNIAYAAQTGAGTVVVKDITNPGLHVGVPARKVDR